MFNCRNYQPLCGTERAAPESGAERERVGFGSTGGKDDASRRGAHTGGDGGPRLLYQSSRLAPLGVNRRRISAEFKGHRHRLARLRAKRGGRIPVEVNPVSHGVLYYRVSLVQTVRDDPFMPSGGHAVASQTDLLQRYRRCSKPLLFAPRPMLERGLKSTSVPTSSHQPLHSARLCPPESRIEPAKSRLIFARNHQCLKSFSPDLPAVSRAVIIRRNKRTRRLP